MSIGEWLLLSAMPGAVHHRHVIQQRAVAVGRRLQLPEQPGEHLHVIGVDLGDLRDLLRFLLMVRDRVMRVGHADLRIGHAAVLVSHHEGDDAREIALKRQHLQVEHQVHVIFPARRDAGGMIDERQLLIALRLGNLDALLHVANRVEILGQLRPIALRQRSLQVRELLAHRIEHAPLLAQPRQPDLRIGAGAVAEQALEHDARVVLRRQRRVRALPADRVRVGAGEPPMFSGSSGLTQTHAARSPMTSLNTFDVGGDHGHAECHGLNERIGHSFRYRWQDERGSL